MKILLLDTIGLALDHALRFKAAGHDVRWFIDKPADKSRDERIIGTGMIEKITRWQPSVKWADLIFLADNTSFLKELESMGNNLPIFGASKQGALLELSRELGQDIFKKFNIKIAPYETFTDISKAIDFIIKNNKRYVSKPNTDPGKEEESKAMSYVAKSPEDMIFMLNYWKKNRKLKNSFILQEFIPGIEMAVGGWLGPHGFNKYLFENWEFKKFMPGDLGIQTGEMGTCARYTTKSKLASTVLLPLEEELVNLGITGYVDINCIIAEDGTPYPLEFTVRPGYPCSNLQMALHRGDPAQWMLDCINGEDTLKVNTDPAICVVISQPDFPYSNLTQKDVTGMPITGIDLKDNNIHPCEMMFGETQTIVSGKLKTVKVPVTAGDYILVVSGIGKTIKDAMSTCYEKVKNVKIPNSIMYRNDIGLRLEEQLPILQKFGYCPDLKFSGKPEKKGKVSETLLALCGE